MSASNRLESIDQRLAQGRERLMHLRQVAADHPQWPELPRVLRLAEESLNDLAWLRDFVASAQQEDR